MVEAILWARVVGDEGLHNFCLVSAGLMRRFIWLLLAKGRS